MNIEYIQYLLLCVAFVSVAAIFFMIGQKVGQKNPDRKTIREHVVRSFRRYFEQNLYTNGVVWNCHDRSVSDEFGNDECVFKRNGGAWSFTLCIPSGSKPNIQKGVCVTFMTKKELKVYNPKNALEYYLEDLLEPEVLDEQLD